MPSEMSYSHNEVESPVSKPKAWRRLCFCVGNDSKHRTVPEKRVTSPEHTASFLSRLTFQWVSSLLRTGYRRPLELNDIWLINPDRAVQLHTSRFKAFYTEAMDQQRSFPLQRSLYRTFKSEFLLGGICQLGAGIFQVTSPLALRYLIRSTIKTYITKAAGKGNPHLYEGVGLVVGISAMQFAQGVLNSHATYLSQIVGAQMRAVLTNAIFGKSLRISSREKVGSGSKSSEKNEGSGKRASGGPGPRRLFQSIRRHWTSFSSTADKKGTNEKDQASQDGVGWTNGRLMSLMSTDCYRVDQAMGNFHLLWTSLVTISIAIVILCMNLGWPAVIGSILLLVAGPALAQPVRTLFKQRKAVTAVTDQRTALTLEILSGIRIVKLFGWEQSFLRRMQDLRNKEASKLRILFRIRSAIGALSKSLPIFASFLSFLVYSFVHTNLDPSRIFSSLALFNWMRLPLTLLPMALSLAIDAWSSFGTIQSLLQAEERNEDFDWEPRGPSAMKVSHADFTWETTSKHNLMEVLKAHQTQQLRTQTSLKTIGGFNMTSHNQSSQNRRANSTLKPLEDQQRRQAFQLLDIDLSIARDELIAVVGKIGSGKSSLLAALAGEMRKISGSVAFGATRAFCPQIPWLENTSVRENILLGKEYDASLYESVVEASALTTDCQTLPNGDLTMVGERGVTLSGGQKQRISLARALYSRAGILLLDDPLSAVDAHVGQHIIDNAIFGISRGKCRILATHHLHILQRCDRVLWMVEGQIKALGSYDQLMSSDHDFQSMMAHTSQQVTSSISNSKAFNVGKTPAQTLNHTSNVGGDEDRAVKAVSWKVYAAWINASGSIFFAFVVFFILVLAQGLTIITSLWLAWWVGNKFKLEKSLYIGLYAVLGISQAFMMFLFSNSLFRLGTQSSQRLYHQALEGMLHSAVSFFDQTPMGRINNRLTRDMDVLDNYLSDVIGIYLFTVATIFSIFILIIVYFHYFAAAVVPLLLLFLLFASYYRASARELKRHEAVQRTAIFSQFTESAQGIVNIRAYNLVEAYSQKFSKTVDQANSVYYLTIANQRWLALRLSTIGNCLVFVTGMLAVTNTFEVHPSIIGLILTYTLLLSAMLQLVVREMAAVENSMISMERIHAFTTQLEPEQSKEKSSNISKAWPSRGKISFHDISLRYQEHLPLTLQSLNLTVAAGEHLAIVGRTGAGKSSLISALFRLVPICNGSICIDDIDITRDVHLQDLRRRLAIIPQDPVIFSGTIRYNLDPFHQHSDLELWAALREAHLISPDHDTTTEQGIGKVGLDGEIGPSSGGHEFSLGQRQLLALARALVRNPQVLVCDEATSSVDMQMDAKIQETIATKFSGKTVICIAHRLRTILKYDRVAVMDQGKIVELGPPLDLWKSKGLFCEMCETSKISESEFS